jgi:hypothetical protein
MEWSLGQIGELKQCVGGLRGCQASRQRAGSGSGAKASLDFGEIEIGSGAEV